MQIYMLSAAADEKLIRLKKINDMHVTIYVKYADTKQKPAQF